MPSGPARPSPARSFSAAISARVEVAVTVAATEVLLPGGFLAFEAMSGMTSPSPSEGLAALGPRWVSGPRERVAFSVHARPGRGIEPRVEVEIFEVGGGDRVAARVPLERDAAVAEPFSIWRGEWPAALERFEYVVRVGGGPPLVDPYAPCLTGGEVWGRSDDLLGPGVGRRHRGLFGRELGGRPGRAAPGLTAARPPQPRVDERARVIYELHVRGFTRHPSSGVARPGTYAGLVEKIPYLVSLGVTTVELLPVFEFDETENPRRSPETGERLLNFWGYSPISFFAPKAGYAADPTPGAAVGELRQLVDELHRAGLEVVVDVVYNHTAEGAGGAGDPLHSWRGLDGEGYYLRDPETGRPLDFTGCGNTVDAQHPVARRLILDSLRHWVESYYVDGFRFDLAAFLYRDGRGEVVERPPLLDEIAALPELDGRLLIAEPWDVVGFTPRGGFPAPWREWNGPFRDDMRRLVRGDRLSSELVALRLAGSPDRFSGSRSRLHAVDFVACHDGFPVADLVAYDRKHNQANGEGNRDGAGADLSWNCGVEGPTEDAAVAALRPRQVRNLLALTGLSGAGNVLLLAGDERGRTQRGNNNAWCQDNEIGWLDWGTEEPESVGWTRRLLALRRELADLARDPMAISAPFAAPGEPAAGALVLYRNPVQASAGAGATGVAAALIAVNPTPAELTFPLPTAPDGLGWSLAVDTAVAWGAGNPPPGARPRLAPRTSELRVAARSVRVLVAR